jgi:hypothetical protein
MRPPSISTVWSGSRSTAVIGRTFAPTKATPSVRCSRASDDMQAASASGSRQESRRAINSGSSKPGPLPYRTKVAPWQ